MLWYLLKVVVVYVALCVPVPSNRAFLTKMRNCSREQSHIVRYFIHAVWRPVFKRLDVQMPEQCPLHFSRDVFAPQELAKRHYRANLWTCAICGKSFYREPYLELHMSSKHPDHLILDDNAVCLADFCDVFRCQVWAQGAASGTGNWLHKLRDHISLYHPLHAHDAGQDELDELVDSEAWMERDKTALMAAPPPDVIKVLKDDGCESSGGPAPFVVGFDPDAGGRKPHASEDVKHDPFGWSKGSPESGWCPSRSDGWRSSRPRSRSVVTPKTNRKQDLSQEFRNILRYIQTQLERKLQLAKSNSAPGSGTDHCDHERMAAAHEKCTDLIDSCTSPLILHLGHDRLLKMQGELYGELCWFLTCDRYRHPAGQHTAALWNASHLLMLLLLCGSLALLMAAVFYASSAFFFLFFLC